MSGHEQAEDLHTLIADRLRRADQRYTPGRRAIVELLVHVGQPVSIGEIGEDLPGLPRSSAYRNLVDLEGAGVVRRVAANDEFSRFELTEEFTEHHHHLLCVECGTVIDIRPSSTFERTVTRHLDTLADEVDFEPLSHRIDVLGRCASCK